LYVSEHFPDWQQQTEAGQTSLHPAPLSPLAAAAVTPVTDARDAVDTHKASLL